MERPARRRICVNAASESKADAAWEFITFMTSPENQKFRAIEGGFLPPLDGLYDDPEILEKVPVVRLGEEAIKSARLRPVSPYYSYVSLVMAEQFNASLGNNKSPEAATRRLQGRMSEILEAAQG